MDEAFLEIGDSEQQELKAQSGDDSDEWGYIAFSAAVLDTPPIGDIDHEAISFLDTPVEGLDDDGFLLASWAMDETSVVGSLEAWGFTGMRLAVQQGDETVLLNQIFQHLGMEVSAAQFKWHLHRLIHSIRMEVERLPLHKRIKGFHLPPLAQQLQDSIQAHHNLLKPESVQAKAESFGLLPPKGIRRRMQMQAAKEAGDIEQVEGLERNRLLEELQTLLELSSAPLVQLAIQSGRTLQVLKGAVGDTRNSTLRQYVRSISTFQSWFLTAHSKAWPTDVIGFLEYLHVRIEEPCALSIPSVFAKALNWFEKVGAFEGSSRFGNHQTLLRTIDYSAEVLGSFSAPTKKAARPPTAVVAALEIYVCDGCKQLALRVKAFQMLLKIYCSLREDDAQNLSPRKFRWFSGILTNTLCRTKTTGPTKRIKELPVCLGAEVSITSKPWIITGLALIQELEPKEREFLLTNFQANLEAGKPGRLSYANSAALGQRLLGTLKVPAWEEREWKETGIQLIPTVFLSAFTEHGPRSFMPSLLAELEVEKSQRDYVGRWSPTGSDDYTRSYRTIVKRLQATAIDAIRSGDSRLGDGDVFERLTDFGERLGVEDLESHFSWLRESLRKFQLCLKQFHESTAADDDISICDQPASELPLTSFPIALTVEALKKKRVYTRVAGARSKKFLLIFSQGRRFSRLHLSTSACPWVHTIVRDCEELEEVNSGLYNARCKICFPAAGSDSSDSGDAGNI